MNKEEIKEVAGEVFKLLKEHAKKVKKYSKGTNFDHIYSENKQSRSISLDKRTWSNVIRHSHCAFKVCPDNFGEIYIVPVAGQGLAYTIKEFEKYVKKVNEAFEFAKKMEENIELKDVLDP